MTPHVSTLTLHQYRYGELEGSARAEVESHLRDCDACRARHDVQLAERAAFELQSMPEAIADLAPTEAGAGWLGWLRRYWAGIGSVALVAAAGLVGFALVGPPVNAPIQEETIRIKGTGAPLEAWIADGDGIRALADGEALGAGAQVQLRYDPGTAAWSTLAGRDGTGVVQVYGLMQSTTNQGGLRTAPFSFVLDDAPGPQEFFLVNSAEPLTDAEVEAAIRRGGDDVHQVAYPRR